VAKAKEKNLFDASIIGVVKVVGAVWRRKSRGSPLAATGSTISDKEDDNHND